MRGDLSAAYAVWRYAQRGSGASAAKPESLSEAAVPGQAGGRGGGVWGGTGGTVWTASGDVKVATHGERLKFELSPESRCV